MEIKNLSLVILLFTLIGCSQKHTTVERVNLIPEIINDDLYIQRNCNIIRTKDFFYLGDLKQGDEFVKIYNSNGSFNSKIGQIGNGPEEFTTPELIPYKDNDILVWNKYGRYNSSISKHTEDGFFLNPISINFLNDSIVSLQTDLEGNFITYNPSKNRIITLYSKEGKELFSTGELPYPQSISNISESYSGRIIFNPYNKKLVLALNNLPYISIYLIDKKKITFLKEKEIIKPEFKIVDNNINIQTPGKDCFTEFCLTQNYIITILNDPNYKGSDHSRTSPKRKTVGVYDYDLNLIKIADLNLIRSRLSSHGKDDSFYIIGENPEYCIAKFKL